MDIAAWLWQRVERRDAPAVLAHALSLAPTRDALLRQAAFTEQWDDLAAASEAAADIAREVGWSRSGPDAVAAICRWISAERTLRRVPRFDRAYPLAQAALAAGCTPILVRTGHGAGCEDAARSLGVDLVFDDLPDAVEWLLRR